MSTPATAGKSIGTKSGQNYTLAEVGDFADLRDYALTVGDRVFRGKTFLHDSAGFTAMEISFTSIPAGKSVPFLHHHRQNEEAYIFIEGQGRMQVDNDIFDVQRGSVVRVATSGKRAIGNTSDQPLVYICVQAKEGSLDKFTIEDGVRDDEPPRI